MFFDYIIISQRRYYASNRNNNIANSLIAVPCPSQPNVTCLGELLDIVVLKQLRLGPVRHFGHVRWLVPADIHGLSESAWSKRCVYYICVSFETDNNVSSVNLQTGIWDLNSYADDEQDTLIALESIQSHVVRSQATIMGEDYWVTVIPK